ncbi:MAG: hypothetical protein JO128_03480 [Alphaproteobacteria bacterium]|nr:hypothetical protein [Alphaproteobacteria bacterium]
MPLSAVAVAEPLPAPVPEPTWRERLWQRSQPVVAYSTLFLMGVSGGLGVATAASLTIRVIAGGPDKQVAAVRLVVPQVEPEPLDVEIRKAKAELDAAVGKQQGS